MKEQKLVSYNLDGSKENTHNAFSSTAGRNSNTYTHLESGLHAVCTAQVFRNPYSGLYLYLFSSYYLSLGYLVLIYDRFGWHREYLIDFMNHPHFRYFPYTAMQLADPFTYSKEYAANQSSEFKLYYAKYRSGDSQKVLETQELHKHDRDKTRTYDMARVEYAHARSMLILDSDELLFCGGKQVTMRQYADQHQNILNDFADHFDEVVMIRPIVFGKYPSGVASLGISSRNNITMRCMQEGYSQRSLSLMLGCWGQVINHSATKYNKIMDVSAICPFHYMHAACWQSTLLSHRSKCICQNVATAPMSKCRLLHLTNKCTGDACLQQRGATNEPLDTTDSSLRALIAAITVGDPLV